MANGSAPNGSTKRLQFENNTRAIYHLPSEVADGGFVVLGDKLDTDDRVPQGRARDSKLQPSPKVVMTADEYAKHGKLFDSLVRDLERQGFIRRTELA